MVKQKRFFQMVGSAAWLCLLLQMLKVHLFSSTVVTDGRQRLRPSPSLAVAPTSEPTPYPSNAAQMPEQTPLPTTALPIPDPTTSPTTTRSKNGSNTANITITTNNISSMFFINNSANKYQKHSNTSQTKIDTANNKMHITSPMFTWLRKESMLDNSNSDSTNAENEILNTTCAILFYGLPRKFRDFTLLSLQQNVIPQNPDCDYFVHYYDVVGFENGDRFERGRRGFLNATEILDLKDAVHEMTTTDTIVKFQKTTDDEFHSLYDSFLHKLQVERFEDTGKLIYWPTREDYTNTTVSNVVKMWHSLQSVWNLMKEESAQSGRSYETIAMLRSDVLFVTKLNFRARPASVDGSSQQPFVVIPSFAKHPVNDRMIYGDARGVEIWANQRFQRLDEHCFAIRTSRPENCIDDERYLHTTLFPAMRKEQNVSIVEVNDICFLRVRSDSLVRFDDCHFLHPRRTRLEEHNQRVVEEILQRNCTLNQTSFLTSLECADTETKP